MVHSILLFFSFFFFDWVKTLWKGRKCWLPAFALFSLMLSKSLPGWLKDDILRKVKMHRNLYQRMHSDCLFDTKIHAKHFHTVQVNCTGKSVYFPQCFHNKFSSKTKSKKKKKKKKKLYITWSDFIIFLILNKLCNLSSKTGQFIL